MYVIPFSMGPSARASPISASRFSDSAYVATNMRIATRMGQGKLDVLGESAATSCPASTRSVSPSPKARRMFRGPVTSRTSTFAASRRAIDLVVRLGLRQERAAWGEKCFALRIASVMARPGVGSPRAHAHPRCRIARRRKTYVGAAFAPGWQDELAMLVPPKGFRGLEDSDDWR